MNLVHPAKHLTSNYEKDADSNNYKLLSLGHLEHEEILANLNIIEAYRDIDEAAGFTLDKAGKNVLELRNGRDDETFRQAIRIKIRGSLSAGTIEDIIAVAEIVFGGSFVSVQETWDKSEYGNEPAALVLSIKDDPDAQAVFLAYIKNLIMVVKAGGVSLYNKMYSEISVSNICIGSVLSADSCCLRIPTMIATDIEVLNAVYIGVNTTFTCRMRIPAAELREA